METIVYSILLDFDEFGNYLLVAIGANFGWLCSLIGLKIGLIILKDSAN